MSEPAVERSNRAVAAPGSHKVTSTGRPWGNECCRSQALNAFAVTFADRLPAAETY